VRSQTSLAVVGKYSDPRREIAKKSKPRNRFAECPLPRNWRIEKPRRRFSRKPLRFISLDGIGFRCDFPRDLIFVRNQWHTIIDFRDLPNYTASMRIEMGPWRIEIPLGWAAIVGSDQSSLRLFHNPETRDDHYASAVEGGDGQVTFFHFPLLAGVDVKSFAETSMERHVRQGEPERYSQVLHGRFAHAYSWGNGVEAVDTFFVEATPSVVLRIDITTGFEPSGRVPQEVRDAAAAIIGTLEWV
jgi:hypothetical protein